MIKFIDRNEKTKMLLSLMRSGFSIREACEVVELKYSQGSYALKRAGVTRTELQAQRNTKIRPGKVWIDKAIKLLKQGATPEEVALLTQVSLSWLVRWAKWPPYRI